MTNNEIVEDALNIYGEVAEEQLTRFLDQFPRVGFAPLVERPQDEVNLQNWKMLKALIARVNRYRYTDLPGETIMEIPYPNSGEPWNVAYLKFDYLPPFDGHPEGVYTVEFYPERLGGVPEIVHSLTSNAEFFQTPHTIEEIENYFRKLIESFLRDKGITPDLKTDVG